MILRETYILEKVLGNGEVIYEPRYYEVDKPFPKILPWFKLREDHFVIKRSHLGYLKPEESKAVPDISDRTLEYSKTMVDLFLLTKKRKNEYYQNKKVVESKVIKYP